MMWAKLFCGVLMKTEPRSPYRCMVGEWQMIFGLDVGNSFFTMRTVRQWDRSLQFLNTLSFQVFKTQLHKSTWPQSEMILLWSGCWEWRCPKPFLPWIMPCSYIFWISSFPSEWKRSPWVLFIKASLSMLWLRKISFPVVGHGFLLLQEPIVRFSSLPEECWGDHSVQAESKEISAKIYFVWYISEGRENKEKLT